MPIEARHATFQRLELLRVMDLDGGHRRRQRRQYATSTTRSDMLSTSIFARQTARTVFRSGAVRFNSSAASSGSKPAITESEVAPHAPGHHLTTAAPKEE